MICFMDEQPDFYFKVEIEGEEIGTARHLTDDDQDYINRYADRKLLVKDGEIQYEEYEKDGEKMKLPRYEMNIQKQITATILCAFGGKDGGNDRKIGQEGWKLNRECTPENINLLDRYLKYEIFNQIMKKEQSWQEKKGELSKN